MSAFADPAAAPEPDESRRCQFCVFRGPLTREHVWPQQYRKMLPGVRNATHQRGSFGTGPTHTWSAKAFSTQARITCHDCNHVRLRGIEEEALELFSALAATDPSNATSITTLSSIAQRQLAAFALRMFAVTQYTNGTSRPVPRWHREHLVQHRSPPQHIDMWAFACAGATPEIRMQCGASRVAGPGEPLPLGANAYRGVLRFGSLVVEVAAMWSPRPFPIRPQDRRLYVPLWPLVIGRVGIWPPERWLDDSAYQGRLANLDGEVVLRA